VILPRNVVQDSGVWAFTDAGSITVSWRVTAPTTVSAPPSADGVSWTQAGSAVTLTGATPPRTPT
jgi:hypothetical protein